MAMMAAMVGHGRKPGDLIGALSGGNIWWVSPTYKQTANSKIWQHLKRACADTWFDRTRISEVDKTIRFPGGGEISIHSADSGSSNRGAGVDGMVIDEAAFLEEETWLEELRPSLADRGGWAILQSTPNGKNWFYKLFQQSKGRPDWECWQRPSSDNPLMSQDELSKLLIDQGPRKFAQEHLGQFIEIEGAIFPGHYFDDHIWAERWPDAFDIVVIAVDPSIGNEAKPGDYSAIVMVGLSGGRLWVQADMDRRPPLQIVQDAVRMAEEYRPHALVVEANGFQAVLGNLFSLHCQMENKPPQPLAMLDNREKKIVRIQRLDPYLANHELVFRRCNGCEMLIEQLQMFPDKDWHDDGPDALEMAIRLCEELLQGTAGAAQPEILYA